MISDIESISLIIEPIDMRCGVDRLSGWIAHSLEKAPSYKAAYVFRNKRTTRIKALIWDANGVWLCQRRLHRGAMVWPSKGDQNKVFPIRADQWQWLVRGVDWQRFDDQMTTQWVF